MKHLIRILFESSPFTPFWSAWLAGYVVVAADGGVYRTDSGQEYLDDLEIQLGAEVVA